MREGRCPTLTLTSCRTLLPESRQHAQPPKSAQFELAVWQFSDSESDDEVVPQQRQVAPQECE
eukprot:806077-Prorocentrum_minimum.AAC.1